jgi:hypothetical protein
VRDTAEREDRENLVAASDGENRGEQNENRNPHGDDVETKLNGFVFFECSMFTSSGLV